MATSFFTSAGAPGLATSDARPYHALRVLIVDDNHINLSMLARLLKRKFSHVLEGEPVTVDSALKAIQLLQQRIFDVILMDIQMPFLNGLEATMRIRNAEDGILQANSTAHVVAVTTAVGDEPEAAYRRAGMDGMIGKPVRQQDIEVYLNSLSQEAFIAFAHTPSTKVGDRVMAPPLPPTTRLAERAFYMPADHSIRSPVDEICADSGFEHALHVQTLDSLKKSGISAIAETQGVEDATADKRNESAETSQSTDAIIADDREVSYPTSRHARGASLNMEQLGQQIAREMANVGDKRRKTPSLSVRTQSSISTASAPLHRSLSQLPSEITSHVDDALVASPSSVATPDFERQDDIASDCVDLPPLCSSSNADARRASNPSSSSSEATTSDETDVTTPSSEGILSPLSDISSTKDGYFHYRSASSSTAGNVDDDIDAYSTDSTATDQTIASGAQLRADACSKHRSRVSLLTRLEKLRLLP